MLAFGCLKATLATKIHLTSNKILATTGLCLKKANSDVMLAKNVCLAERCLLLIPWVKEWGLVDMNSQETQTIFPKCENLRLNLGIRGPPGFRSNEPSSAIVDAVREGRIASSCYENYVSMIMGKDNRK